MNAHDLASICELIAQGLRMLPAGSVPGAQGLVLPVAQTLPSRTLGEWMDIHGPIVLGKGYKQQTVRNRSANMAHVKRLWGTRPIADLRAHEIITAIRKEFVPHQLSTAQRVLAELRDAYHEAIASDWVQVNPALGVKLPSQRVKRKRLPFATWEKMRDLARASNQPWLESLMLLALVTGQRRGDLVKMRFDDIVDGALRVEQQKQAGKGWGARVAIPLSLHCEAIGMTVGDVVEHCRKSGAPGDYLLRRAGGQPLEESSLSIRFRDCIRAVCGLKAYGKDEWPSLHEVRSLAARTYIDQGFSQETVQALLGHMHSEMTDAYVNDRGLSAKQWKSVDIKMKAAA